jgi:hypothetical protein
MSRAIQGDSVMTAAVLSLQIAEIQPLDCEPTQTMASWVKKWEFEL